MRGDRLAVRAQRRLEAPVAHGFDGFLFQAQARALYDLDVRGATVRR